MRTPRTPLLVVILFALVSLVPGAVAASVKPQPKLHAAPKISGRAIEGDLVTSTKGSWSGSPTHFSFAWKICDKRGARCLAVRGATKPRYLIQLKDIGHTVRVFVTAKNAHGHGSAKSKPTKTVAAAPKAKPATVPSSPGSGGSSTPGTGSTSTPPPTGGGTSGGGSSGGGGSGGGGGGGGGGSSDTTPPSAPTNLAVTSSTQTSLAMSWTAASDNIAVTGYRAYLDGAQVGTTATTTYSFSGLPCGTNHTLGIAAYDAAGNVSGTTAIGGATSACSGSTPPSNTGAPAVSGTAQVGQMLSTTKGVWSGTAPITYTYQWQDCNTSGTSCAAIAGATSSSYSLTAADQGATIRSRLTATNSAGSASVSSAQTAIVQAAAPPPPPPSGLKVMTNDLGWAPTANMPWSALTQVVLFTLVTQNGPGLGTGNISGVNVANWVAAAHAHNVQAMIAIGGIDDQNWQNACNNTNRAQFVTNLVNYAVSHGFDGIDLDIEDNLWSSQGPPAPAMTTCIIAIATAAHAATSQAGKTLWVSEDVTTNWMGSWVAPSQSYIDQFNLMTYGDNLTTLNADVQDTFNQGLPYAKMMVGVDVDEHAEPSGGCTQFATYARQHGLMGSFIWDAASDTAKANNACTNGLAAG